MPGIRTTGFGCLVGALAATQVSAEVADVRVTDVTDRSFSVVWASNNPVDTADVRVFNDEDGLVELAVESTFISEMYPPALDNGVVKMSVSGLQPGTTVYYQSITSAQIPDDGVAGEDRVAFPASPPFPPVTTAMATAMIDAESHPVVNDMLRIDGLQPDHATPAPGTLIVLEAQQTGSGPISAFVSNIGIDSNAIVDLNNMRDSTGQKAEIPDDEILLTTHYRGRLCSQDSQKLVRFRRVPSQSELPLVTEIEDATNCFIADTVCDDTVNILDLQFVLNSFNRTLGECAFNPDLDVVADNVINILDAQVVLNRFGQAAPFQ